MDTSTVRGIIELGSRFARGAQGLDHYWDPGGIPHHSMDWVSHGVRKMVDPVIRFTPIFIFPSELWIAPVTGWADKDVGKFHELSWHVGCTWDCRMIILLWQELVGGSGFNRPPDMVLYGDGAFSLGYWTLELLRIGSVVLFTLTCEELGLLGLSRQMRRYSSHRGVLTSRMVVEMATLIGCKMMHMDSVLDLYIQGCIWVCNGA